MVKCKTRRLRKHEQNILSVQVHTLLMRGSSNHPPGKTQMTGADASTETRNELSLSCGQLVEEIAINPRTVTVAFVLRGKCTPTMKTNNHYLAEELR